VSAEQLRYEVSGALSGPPEPVRRRQAQQDALIALARLEGGGAEGGERGSGPHPHLTRLEASPAPSGSPSAGAVVPGVPLTLLSSKQRQLLAAVGQTRTVSEAAVRLAVSRSNVYAGLRRIAAKLGIGSVTELVHRARVGGLV
jgi:DNA-binding CsgD family transcriptional regulator